MGARRHSCDFYLIKFLSSKTDQIQYPANSVVQRHTPNVTALLGMTQRLRIRISVVDTSSVQPLVYSGEVDGEKVDLIWERVKRGFTIFSIRLLADSNQTKTVMCRSATATHLRDSFSSAASCQNILPRERRGNGTVFVDQREHSGHSGTKDDDASVGSGVQ